MDVVKESYTIGVDFSSNTDYSTMAISKREGDKVTLFNTFCGKDAEEKYQKFIELFGVSSDVGAVIIPKSNNDEVK